MIDGVDVPEDGPDAVDHAGQLLLRVADGDQAAFARLYDMLSPRAFGLILRVLVDRVAERGGASGGVPRDLAIRRAIRSEQGSGEIVGTHDRTSPGGGPRAVGTGEYRS